MPGATDHDPLTLLPPMGRAVAQVARWAGILAVLAMFISMNIEVIGRNFFAAPTIWVTEVSTYLVVATTFLMAGFVAARGGNVQVDVILQLLPPSWSSELRRAAAWGGLLLALILAWTVTGLAAENWSAGTRSWSLLRTPVWIPNLAIVVGLAMLTMIMAIQAIHISSRTKGLQAAAAIAVLTAAALAFGEPLHRLWPRQPLLVPGLITTLVALAMLLCERWHTALTILVVGLATAGLFMLATPLGLATKSAILLAALFAFLFGGLPVVFALLAAGFLVIVFWLPPVGIRSVGDRAWGAVASFELTAIPMFVLMGALLVASQASRDLFAAASAWLGRMRAGLAQASIVASGVFAAVSGSSLATAATMGKVAGGEMVATGYRPALAYGVLAAGGTLGILIPPSIAMIIYGPMAGVPVVDLFMAGFVPGALMMLAFSIVVLVWTLIDPSAAPAREPLPLRERIATLTGVLPFLGLIAFVLGSLYLGFATPTEAGGIGALGAMAIGLLKGRLTLRAIIDTLEEAAFVTSFLLLIAVAASVMTFGIDYLSMPQQLVAFIRALDLGALTLFLAIVLVYLVLGMFIEPITMILITLPIILPVTAAAGWDPMWFGIILIMLVEIGLITPPVGMILFVLAGMSQGKVSVGQVSLGALPFVLAYLVMLGVFFLFPEIVTFLPEALS